MFRVFGNEDLMIFAISLLAFIFSFTILYFSRLFLTGNRVSAYNDTFFHLLISESIRKHRGAYPSGSCLQNVTFYEGEKKFNYLAYPPMFHYVTALFPKKYFLSISKLLNLILLSFLSTTVVVLVYTFTSNILISFLSAIIILFNMAIFELEVLFTPRPLGLLFYSLLMIVIIFSPQSLILFLVTILLTSLIILTHKFATQVLIFTLVPYAFFFNQLFLLPGLMFGFLVSILLTRGSYLKILKEHVSWLYFYSFFSYPSNFRQKIKRIFVRNTWYLAFCVSIIFIFFQKTTVFSFDSSTIKMVFWGFLPLTVALLITIPKLSFLGEDYRYIEYSAVPIGILVSLSIATFDYYIMIAILLCFFMSIVVMFRYRNRIRQLNELVNSEDILSYKFLSSYSLGNLLVFPPSRTIEVGFFTKLTVVHFVRRNQSKTYAEDLESLLGTYDVRYVLRFKNDTSKEFTTLSTMTILESFLNQKNFQLFKLQPKEKK